MTSTDKRTCIDAITMRNVQNEPMPPSYVVFHVLCDRWYLSTCSSSIAHKLSVTASQLRSVSWCREGSNIAAQLFMKDTAM
eukprot:17464-Heterococcus_DN1.PRE.2